MLLESAGRPDARASDDLEGAVGLTQILAETGTNLLDMQVDVRASERLTRQAATARGPREADRIRAKRRQVDERFDPQKSLAATGRYLKLAKDEFGREDLAVVSYHMGIGNLQQRARRLRGRRRQLRAGLLRHLPRPAPARVPAAHRAGRRLEDLPLAGARLARGDAPLPRRPREARAARRACTRARPPASSCCTRPDRTEVFETADDVTRPTTTASCVRSQRAPRYGLRPAAEGPRAAPEAFALAVYMARACERCRARRRR